MASRVMARRVAEVIDAAEIEKFVLGVFEVDKSGKILRYISATCGPIRGQGLRAREARRARSLGCTTEEGDLTTQRDPAERLGKASSKRSPRLISLKSWRASFVKASSRATSTSDWRTPSTMGWSGYRCG